MLLNRATACGEKGNKMRNHFLASREACGESRYEPRVQALVRRFKALKSWAHEGNNTQKAMQLWQKASQELAYFGPVGLLIQDLVYMGLLAW